jgi:(4S)-4-hydroxy-5-phosphonooxypentane-2,3-dione isomerase
MVATDTARFQCLRLSVVLIAGAKLEIFGGFAYSSYIYMLVVHIQVHVKPESVEAFKEATLANGRASLKEPGVVRFDVVQQQDDPTRFVFVEVYRDAAAAAAHKETSHYPVWRDTVAPMMAEPRHSVKYNNVFPEDEGW